MKKNFLFFLLIILFFSNIFTQSNNDNYEDMWLSFPACHMGRLQSPVRLNISESKYSNSFSIVYQYFSNITFENSNMAFNSPQPSINLKPNDNATGYINLQRNGVIKQYAFDHIEIFRGLHKVESSKSEFEVHLIFKKQLGFSTNQNQYRRISDTNNYLAIVLRYNNTASLSDNSFQLVNDGGLLTDLLDKNKTDFSKYPIFDRRAFFYEGSQIYNPCSEDYNYIVLYDTFISNITISSTTSNNGWATRDFAHSYDRPIYRNFMNYTETISSGFIKINLIKIIGFLTIIFL
jgi:carbonic anhydrase